MDDLTISAVAALLPFSSALRADGYGLDVKADDQDLYLEVTATSDACEDCLAPRSVMQPMAEELLRAGGVKFASVQLSYPSS